MPLLPFMASEQGPPWLPAAAAESRKLTYWAQLALLIIGIIGLIYGIVSLAVWWGLWGWGGAYYIVGGIIDLLLVIMLNEGYFKPLDQGRFKEASDKLLIFMILGLVFMVLGGLILLFAYIKLQEVFQPQYQPYPTGQYQGAPPPQQPPAGQYAPPPQAPPAQQQAPPQGPPATPEEHKKAEMVKCKKCGVMYPAFMRTCPNCNEPR